MPQRTDGALLPARPQEERIEGMLAKPIQIRRALLPPTTRHERGARRAAAPERPEG